MFEGMSLSIPAIMLLFLMSAFLIKFFPFWLFFDRIKSNNLITNFLTAESMFIKGAVGIFLLLKFIYFYFGKAFLFSAFLLNYPLVIGAIILITFSAIGIYQQKHLQSICSYLCLSNIGFVLAAIGLSNNESLRAAFFYILNFSLINLFIFIFATFLKKNFDSSSLAKISLIGKGNMVLIMPLRLLVFFIASFPLTPLFFANWNMTYASLNPGFEASILIGLIAANFAYVDLAVRFIDAIFAEKDSNSESISASSLKKYHSNFLSFWILLLLIGITVFLAVFVNNLSQHFASYLLSL
jgi:formate hydrogenlyase subunit 3/multisubunit Na+/H+ antiporter MnhD subunit